MVAPGQRQALVAQPHRRGQGVEDGLEVGGFGADGRLFQPHRRHAAHGAAARDQLAVIGVAHRNLERRAAIRQAVNGAGQRQRIGTLETGLQQLFAAAVGIGLYAIAPPHHQRLAARAQQRIALAHRGLGARAGQTQRAAQLGGDTLFRQRPQARGKGQRDAACRQSAQHHDLSRGSRKVRQGGQGSLGRSHEGAGRSQPYPPNPWSLPVSHFGTAPVNRPAGRRITVESIRYRRDSVPHRYCG